VDSIPSSAMQEDHVSMGWHAGRKLRRGIDGLRRVIAIEILTAARALDLRSPLRPGPVTAAVRDVVRSTVAGPGPDRHLGPEIDAVVELLAKGAITAAFAPGPLDDVVAQQLVPTSAPPGFSTSAPLDRENR